MKSELIYRTYEDYGRENYLSQYHKTELGVARTVFRSDKAVTLITSTKIAGRNKHSNKPWYRWVDNSKIGIYRNHKGNLIPFHTYQGGYGAPDSVFFYLNNNNRRIRSESRNAMYAFADAATAQFGVTGLSSIYPVAGMYGLTSYLQMPPTLTSAMREENFRDFVVKVFGKKNIRKDLVKACAKTDPATVALASQFRNLVPIDWIINFLRVNEVEAEVDDEYRGRDRYTTQMLGNLRKNILPRLDPKSYRRLLQNRILFQTWYQIVDITRVDNWQTDRTIFARNWLELHDGMFPRGMGRVIYTPFEDKEIELIPEAKRIDDLKTDNFLIHPAHHTSEMAKWGDYMNNCIAGYRNRAVDGKGIYGAVYAGEKLKANFEITGGQLRQLLGKANTPLLPSDRDEVVEALKSKGVIVPDKYWGSERWD